MSELMPYLTQNRGLPATRMQTPFRLKPALAHDLTMSLWVGKSAGRFAECQTLSFAMARMYVSRGTGAKGLGDDLTSKDRNVQNTNVQNAEVMVSYRGGCVGSCVHGQ